MGVFRKVRSKFKSIESIIEEMKEAGVAQDEIDAYELLSEAMEKDIKDVNKFNQRLDKVNSKYEKVNDKINKIKKRMHKIKEKVGFPAFIKLRMPFGKDAKEYRILKKQLKLTEKKRDFTYKTIKQIEARIVNATKKIDSKQKEIDKSGKDIKNLWNQYEYQIKFVQEFEYNIHKLEKVYDKKSLKAIKLCVKVIKQRGDLPIGLDIKALYKEIQQAEGKAKKGEKQEISIISESRTRGETIEELLEVKKKKKKEQYSEEVMSVEGEDVELEEFEFTPTEIEAATWNNEEEQEDIKEEEQEFTPTKIEAATWNNEEEQEYIKEEEQEFIPEEVEYATWNNEEEEKEEQTTSKSNEFRKNLRENTIFARSSVDRNKIEALQNIYENPILRSMTPEEFMAWIGFVQSQKNAEKPARYEDFKNDEQAKKLYAKKAIKALEKIKLGKSEDEIEKMSKAEQFLYGIAEDYYDIDKMNKEINDNEQTQMESR